MSLFSLLLFLLLVLPCAQLEDKAEVPPMLVVKSDWARVRYRQDWDKPPLDDRFPDIRNPNPVPDSETPDAEFERRRRKIPGVEEQYSYRATLKNVSGKVAVLIGWDYRFTEAPDETTHHPFLSKIKIKPGQQKEVRGFAKEPPTRTVNAREADKGVNGEVIVNYIEYADGTSWRRIVSESRRQGVRRPG